MRPQDLKAYTPVRSERCSRSLFWRSGSVVSHQDSISWKRPQMRMCILRWDLGCSSITPSDLKAYNKCSRSLNFMVFTKSFLFCSTCAFRITRWDPDGAQDRSYGALDLRSARPFRITRWDPGGARHHLLDVLKMSLPYIVVRSCWRSQLVHINENQLKTNYNQLTHALKSNWDLWKTNGI